MNIPMIYPGKPILHEGSSVYQCLLTSEQIRILEAAPALLEACKELIDLADDGAYIDLANISATPISRKLRAAIAQAEGKE